jgi:hypothetical protein
LSVIGRVAIGPHEPLVVTNASQQRIATTSAVRGRLRESPEFSFDAQLAKLEATGSLGLGMVPFQRVAKSEAEIPAAARVDILTPRGSVPATFRAIAIAWPDIPTPGAPSLNAIRHQEAIECILDGALTRRGDSGSPVVLRQGAVLIGMHFARLDKSDGSFAYAIPIWRLLSPAAYQNALPDERFTIRLQ